MQPTNFMNAPPVIIINCAADLDRRDRISSSLNTTEIHWIDAVDARLGAGVFKPHIALLPEQFWLSDEIKPGAFACFISHRLAWQYLVDKGWDHAIIAEDDSIFLDGWAREPLAVDLNFINDRASAWVPSGNLQDILSPPDETPRAIGGDGYVLSLRGAKSLLEQSELDGVCCGVDWYLAYAGLNTQGLKHRDVKTVPEIKLMWKILGPRGPLLDAKVSEKPMLENSRNLKSSLNHRHQVNIRVLKQEIENA
jgi:hypothetical protein